LSYTFVKVSSVYMYTHSTSSFLTRIIVYKGLLTIVLFILLGFTASGYLFVRILHRCVRIYVHTYIYHFN